MVVVVVPLVRAPLFPWMLRYASIHKSGWFISLRRSFTLLPLRVTSEIALNFSPVLADSIRVSLQLIVRASRTVSLALSFWLSIMLPCLIPGLIQVLPWLLNPLQANVGYYGDSVAIQVDGLNHHTSLGDPAFQRE